MYGCYPGLAIRAELFPNVPISVGLCAAYYPIVSLIHAVGDLFGGDPVEWVTRGNALSLVVASALKFVGPAA